MSEKPSEPGPVEGHRTARALRFHGRGTCLARLEDDPDDAHVLVHRALPGERLTIRPLDPRGRRRWTVSRVLESSPLRVTPECPHAATCSGCALLHLARPDELLAKRDILAEILTRHAGLDLDAETIEVVATTRRFGLRARASWHIESSGMGEATAAFRPLDGPWPDTRDCPAVTPELRAALHALLLHIATLHRKCESDIELQLHRDKRVLTVSAGDRAWPPEDDEALCAAAGISAVLERDGHAVHVRSGDWPGSGDPAVWRHATPECGEQLTDWVLAGIEPAQGAALLDATCGGGDLLLALAPRFGAVVAVDQHHAAVLTAAKRCAEHGFSHVDTRGGRIQTVAPRLARDGHSFHTVLVNPMRRSLGDETMRVLASLAERQLVYLAPAPRAGAADLAPLFAEGWTLRRAALVDLHPGTASMMLAVDLVPPGP